MRLLDNKVALITGGAKGIGKCTAETIAEHGASTIFIVDMDEKTLEDAKTAISEKYDCRCVPIKADVSSEEQTINVFKKISEEAGRLDILVNSAGVCRIVDIDDLEMRAWDLTMDVNLKGPFLYAREALKFMKAQKSGRIINIASQAGKIGGLMVGMDYSSSKAGMLCLTKSLAKNCAEYSVTVNSVAPGLISTDMTTTFGYEPDMIPLRRIGTVEEVADVVLFLASDLSRYMTGACLDVNGGMSMW